MSTRGRLGIELPNGSILSIYNHFDSYPEGLGVKLVEHFNTKEKVQELVDLGDISCIWTNLGFNQESLPETGPLPYSSRGEDCPPRLDADMDEFFSDNEEYSYIFRNGNWYAYDMHQFEPMVAPEPVEIPSAVALAA